MATAAMAYKGHREGSRKGKVHRTFDKKGDKAALTLGRRLKLKDSTLQTWLRGWRPKTKKRPKAK